MLDPLPDWHHTYLGAMDELNTFIGTTSDGASATVIGMLQ